MSKSNRSADQKQGDPQKSGPVPANSARQIMSLLLFFVVVFLAVVAINVIKVDC